MDSFWQNVQKALFSWATIMFQDCNKGMQLVIIPCSEEIVCKTYINIWAPSAHSANLKGIFQSHQTSTKKVFWHSRSGVCSLPLNIVM